MSPRRRKLMWASYALAVFATIGMAVVMSGALAEMAQTEQAEELFGLLFFFLVLIPALVGMGVGFSAIDRRLSNPISVWVATIWNILLIGIFVLLMIIGMTMQ
jgi:hypothetical protein